ncbi:MAG: hypothetical protein L3J71_01630 [Victivallaceae bacterium]|nr:hypothetical protein [Victivallaceae bacterium]
MLERHPCREWFTFSNSSDLSARCLVAGATTAGFIKAWHYWSSGIAGFVIFT